MSLLRHPPIIISSLRDYEIKQSANPLNLLTFVFWRRCSIFHAVALTPSFSLSQNFGPGEWEASFFTSVFGIYAFKKLFAP